MRRRFQIQVAHTRYYMTKGENGIWNVTAFAVDAAEFRHDLRRQGTPSPQTQGAQDPKRQRAAFSQFTSLAVYSLLTRAGDFGSTVGSAAICSFKGVAFLPSASIAFNAWIAM